MSSIALKQETSIVDGYVSVQDDEMPKASMASMLLSRARQTMAATAEMFDDRGYKDLDGDRAPTRLEKAEMQFEELRVTEIPEEPPSKPVVYASENYAQLDDGEEPQEPTAMVAAASSFFSRASDAIASLQKPSKKKEDQWEPPARLDARPFISEEDYTASTLRYELPEEPAGIIAARMEREATEKGFTTGNLWSLKARLVTLNKELDKARIQCADAEKLLAEKKNEQLQAARKRDELQRIEARLREMLIAARELREEEDDAQAAADAADAAKQALITNAVAKNLEDAKKERVRSEKLRQNIELGGEIDDDDDDENYD